MPAVPFGTTLNYKNDFTGRNVLSTVGRTNASLLLFECYGAVPLSNIAAVFIDVRLS